MDYGETGDTLKHFPLPLLPLPAAWVSEGQQVLGNRRRKLPSTFDSLISTHHIVEALVLKRPSALAILAGLQFRIGRSPFLPPSLPKHQDFFISTFSSLPHTTALLIEGGRVVVGC